MSYYFLMIPVLIITFFAQSKLRSTYAKASQIHTSNNMTGQAAARFILDSNGLYDVRIEPIHGELTDHYDPRDRVVRLSEGVYNVPSVAAVGIASHECGHAIQHSVGYYPLKIRNAIIPITNIGSKIAVPLILLGAFFSIVGLIHLGIIAFSLMVLFQLITLPVEFNASARALEVIRDRNMLKKGPEYDNAKSTLQAAALTYVAALLASISQLLYLLTRTRSRRN